ncbi:uncharacterized protein I303_102062 [Kwoniella dejecticola CBS 10117]|uniref:Histone deacetylase complex subunit n=1 Tax=Kwoniella dejecticola CBS 10117 TaxID=1296121 RepID=A0A1A6ABZ5_9TREE|nr:uncharacterized protein I303_01799 [Kwoniella dejecticola CBS 10117]OBR87591.1 hypothetical protein I303_01799 [Kwoniella dejecticola CBS 10117]
MPRSPSPARSRSKSYSRSRSRSPVRRERSGTPQEEDLSPFLIRILVTKGKHVPLIEFDEGNIPHRDEFQVYGWKTSTPSSLIRSLISAFPPPYRSPLARYSFRHIYVDASARGLYRSKDLVSFTGRDLFNSSSTSSSSKNGDSNGDGDQAERQNKMDIDLEDIKDDSAPASASGRKINEKSLDEYGFITGDLLSVSLYIPEPKIPASARNRQGQDGPTSSGVNGIRSFGWDDQKASLGAGSGRHHPAGEDEHWHRGQPLPPQDFRGRGGAGELSIRGGGGGRGGRIDRDRERNGGFEGGEPSGGGNWRSGPPTGLGRGGISGRGASRRSPDYESRRNGRSRSPDTRERRGSWASRR